MLNYRDHETGGTLMDRHETDFYGWTQETAELLRQGKFAEIDIKALIEEVEDMGKSEKRELRNRLVSLLMHLLKWQYQPERRGRSWELTIKNQRQEVLDELTDNPSLKPKLEEIGRRSYVRAVTQAAIETNKDEDIFPATFEGTGWRWEEVLDMAFYPD